MELIQIRRNTYYTENYVREIDVTTHQRTVCGSASYIIIICRIAQY